MAYPGSAYRRGSGGHVSDRIGGSDRRERGFQAPRDQFHGNPDAFGPNAPRIGDPPLPPELPPGATGGDPPDRNPAAWDWGPGPFPWRQLLGPSVYGLVYVGGFIAGNLILQHILDDMQDVHDIRARQRVGRPVDSDWITRHLSQPEAASSVATITFNTDVPNYLGGSIGDLDMTAWQDIFPHQRFDLIGYVPDGQGMWLETLPATVTPYGDNIWIYNAASGYGPWAKPGVGQVFLDEDDPYLIETFHEYAPPGDPGMVIQRLVFRGVGTTWAERWTGPRDIVTEERPVMVPGYGTPAGHPVRTPLRVKEVGPLKDPARKPTKREMIELGWGVSVEVKPAPDTEAGGQPTPGKGPPVLVPPAFATPPKERTKERKIKTGNKAALTIIRWAISAATEGLDLLGAVWNALPDNRRTGMVRVRARNAPGETGTHYIYVKRYQPTPQAMALDLWHHWDDVRLDEAVKNIVRNEVEDFIIGRVNQQIHRNMRWYYDASGIQHGITTGMSFSGAPTETEVHQALNRQGG